MDEKVRALVDELRKSGFEDVEIGGSVHGAVIQLAVRMGMPKDKFMEMSEMLYTRVQAIVADTKKEQN